MKFIVKVEVSTNSNDIKGKTMQAIVDFLKKEDLGNFDVSYYHRFFEERG